MQIKGIITQVMPVQEGMGKKGKWAKQEFVVEMGGQYPKKVCMSLWGEEKINNYDLTKGLKVTASVELESREYNGKWYTEVRAWKIEWEASERKWGASEGSEKKSPGTEGGRGEYAGDGPKDDVDGVDDLPF